MESSLTLCGGVFQITILESCPESKYYLSPETLSSLYDAVISPTEIEWQVVNMLLTVHLFVCFLRVT